MPEDTKSVKLTPESLAELIGQAVAKANEPLAERMQNLEAKTPSKIRVNDAVPTVPAEAADAEDAAIEKRIAEIKRSDPANGPRPDEFSFIRYIMAKTTGEWQHAKFERYAIDESRRMHTNQKALSYGTGSAGGNLVDQVFLADEFVNLYRANLVTKQAGMTMIQAQQSPVIIPKITAGATTYWIAENATITASQQTFGQISMTPKFLVARTQISQFLASSSLGLAERVVREDLALSLANEIDETVLHGAGITTATNEPTGLANTSSINTVDIGTEGGNITFSKLRDMEYAMLYDNVPPGGWAWVMHPRTWNYICKMEMVQYSGQTSGGGFFFGGQPEQAVSKSLFGYPVYLTTNVSIAATKGTLSTANPAIGTALAHIFLVKWPDVILCEWGGISLAATDVGGDAWTKNMIEIKASYACDVDVRNANSVCVCNEVTA